MYVVSVVVAAYETQRLQEHVQTEGSETDSFPNKRRNQFLGAVVALTAMAGYVFATGLVRVSLSLL